MVDSSNRILDSKLIVPLKKWHERLLHLKSRWSNGFATSLRFDWHVSNASEVSQRLAGRLPIVNNLTWTQPSIVPFISDDPLPTQEIIFIPANPIPDCDTELITDILVAEQMEQQDEDDSAIDTRTNAEQTHAELIWMLPVSGLSPFMHCFPCQHLVPGEPPNGCCNLRSTDSHLPRHYCPTKQVSGSSRYRWSQSCVHAG
jgi:hypothetical protein